MWLSSKCPRYAVAPGLGIGVVTMTVIESKYSITQNSKYVRDKNNLLVSSTIHMK